MAEEKNSHSKDSGPIEDVVTIDVKLFITPFAIVLSALIISFSFLAGISTLNSTLSDGGVALGTATVGTPTPTPTPTADPEPTTGVTSIDDDASLGNDGAKVALIEFSDYNCSFCGRYHTDGTMDQIVSNYVDSGDILYVYRDFPGVGGETTANVASAAECIRRDLGGSDEQFFEFVKKKYNNQQANDFETLGGYVAELGLDKDAFIACANEGKYLDEVYADLSDATNLGIGGTPSFLVGTLNADGTVDGDIVVGAQPYSVFASTIDSYLD